MENKKPFVTVLSKDLTGQALDLGVALSEGFDVSIVFGKLTLNRLLTTGRLSMGQSLIEEWNPSTNPAQSYPIIDREKISTEFSDKFNREQMTSAIGREWEADMCKEDGLNFSSWFSSGSTPLIAAMRCYVESKMGPEIQIPSALWNESMPVVKQKQEVSEFKRNKP